MSWNLVHIKDIPRPHLYWSLGQKHRNLRSHALVQKSYVAKNTRLVLKGLTKMNVDFDYA